MNEQAKLQPELSQAGYEFLMSDLTVALTLTRIASRSAADSDKRIRNVQNARRAYDKVRELAGRVSLTGSQLQNLVEKLQAVKSALEKVGKSV
jgi:multidrug efflux pump subunit AcrA (membrane-fusion protein)